MLNVQVFEILRYMGVSVPFPNVGGGVGLSLGTWKRL